MKSSKTVFVGLSGGVDSSVAALTLKEAGYDVVGVFIRVWHPDFLQCNWEAERRDAMRVAATIQIPFLTCDAREAYKQEVADYFISEYKAGRTPNPDVLCNKAVKFGVFYEFAKAHGADYVATGHYAQCRRDGNGNYTLHRGEDSSKDQSYFLWMLEEEILENVLFPLGELKKSEVRSRAERAGLATAKKDESQGICFLGHVDIPLFLSHFIKLTPGDVLNEAGEEIGTHQGALVYTIGQRHGFTVTKGTEAGKIHYVLSRDLTANTITVRETPPTEERGSTIMLTHTNWLGTPPAIGDPFQVQFRYRQTPQEATLIKRDGHTVTITLREEGDPAVPGQSCVCYVGDRCCGGGIIAS